MLVLVIVLLCLGALTLFAIAPGRASEDKKAPFLRRNIAHRGLYENDQSVPENSLAAFARAAESGYGIELDIHLTRDDQLAVFHDDDLGRMCGVPGRPEDKTFAELSALRLAGTEEGIPLFESVLELMDGREPIILELKRGDRNNTLCEKAYAALKNYSGDVCIESFDPFIVAWWRKNAPEYLRGQLSTDYKGMREGTGAVNSFLLSRLLTNLFARPQFVAYGLCEKKPVTVRLCEAMGAMRVVWTSHDPAAEAKNDTVIFEHYRPDTKY